MKTDLDPMKTVGGKTLSRRSLLGGVAVLGAGALFSACGSDKSSDTTVVTDTTPAAAETTAAAAETTAAAAVETAAAGSETTAAAVAAETTAAAASGDAAIAQLAAGLEVLAVNTYGAALDAATAGKLGDVPPAVATFATTAKEQHQKHLDAWNAVLTGAGLAAVTEPNAKLKPTVDTAFTAVKDVTGVAKLALQLEEIAAATYLSASPLLKDPAAIKLAGSIQIIDAQHAAILHYVLGDYPVPDVFAKTDLAAS